MQLSLHRHYRSIVAVLLLLAVIFWTMAFLQSLRTDTPTAAAVTDPQIRTVIIDPGHGGIDPGTASQNGLREKDINLSIATHLCAWFSAAGYRVIMTRDTDTDLSTPGKSVALRKTEDLKARLALFEQTENAIVLSIHQNHYAAASSHGAQMFYGTKSPLSKQLADAIQQSIITNLQTENTRQIKPIEQSVYIIHHTTKPAVLCECGFLSNPEEAALLSDETYCKKMAFSIFSGVLRALG